jgi:hypothetical protein
MPLSLQDYMTLPAMVADIRAMEQTIDKRSSEARSNKLRETAKQLIDGAARLVAAAKAENAPADNLTELVNDLLAFEREQAASLAEARRLHGSFPKLPTRVPAHQAEELASARRSREHGLTVLDETIELSVGVIEAARDARWQLAALRTEREDQGDEPVIGSVGEFDRQYVRG